jgi:hypothetical protein
MFHPATRNRRTASTNIAPTTALAFTMGSGTYCCAVRCRPKREAAVPASDRYILNWVGESWANIAARPPSACDGHVWSRRIRLAVLLRRPRVGPLIGNGSQKSPCDWHAAGAR